MTTPVVNKGHVYFGSEDRIPRDNCIVVKENSPGLVQIHLGFLQYHHIYNVSFEISKAVFSGYGALALLEASEKWSTNDNIKVISIEEERDVFQFLIEFHAEKERLLKEDFKFCMDDGAEIKFEFSARVLGPGKGTPLLKNGIKCVGVVKDELAEASDCQG